MCNYLLQCISLWKVIHRGWGAGEKEEVASVMGKIDLEKRTVRDGAAVEQIFHFKINYISVLEKARPDWKMCSPKCIMMTFCGHKHQ